MSRRLSGRIREFREVEEWLRGADTVAQPAARRAAATADHRDAKELTDVAAAMQRQTGDAARQLQRARNGVEQRPSGSLSDRSIPYETTIVDNEA
ncbi:hypothetical protein Scep_021941 [Stephania cephalantha]|uniref:Uncharacterized protein n=1 Tax=Stephania cephalantha TaxID=152367 RepID=A0AAP0F725_9MAGN